MSAKRSKSQKKKIALLIAHLSNYIIRVLHLRRDSDGEITEKPTAPESQQQNPWWKFWIQVSRSDSSIEMEEGKIGILDDPSQPSSSRLDQPSTSYQSSEPSSKDYFGDEWRRDDWASLDDFEIPNPDMAAWTRPHFTTTIKTPLSTRE